MPMNRKKHNGFIKFSPYLALPYIIQKCCLPIDNNNKYQEMEEFKVKNQRERKNTE